VKQIVDDCDVRLELAQLLQRFGNSLRLGDLPDAERLQDGAKQPTHPRVIVDQQNTKRHRQPPDRIPMTR